MFVKLENDKDMIVHICADEIAMVGEVNVQKPKLFIGSMIGFKNGQTMIVKQKPKQVMEWVNRALQSKSIGIENDENPAPSIVKA